MYSNLIRNQGSLQSLTMIAHFYCNGEWNKLILHAFGYEKNRGDTYFLEQKLKVNLKT